MRRRRFYDINGAFFGVLVGLALGLCQCVWVALVGLGWAQPVVDFVFHTWFFEPVLRVRPFDAVHGLALIIAMMIVGYGMGWGVAQLVDSDKPD